MFIIFYTVSLCAGRYIHFLLISISILGIIVLALFHADALWWKSLALGDLCKYFQFFAFGILARKYNRQFMWVVKNDLMRAFFILGFLACIMLVIYGGDFTGKYAIRTMAMRYLGLIVVFVFFLSKEKFFKTDGKISRCMQFVGRRTLDIYMIHYFLMPHLPGLTPIINDNVIIELLVTAVLSGMIIAVFLLLSEVIRSSEFLAHYLFGVKSEKYKI